MRRGIHANKKSRRDLYLEKMHTDGDEDTDMVYIYGIFMVYVSFFCKKSTPEKTKLLIIKQNYKEFKYCSGVISYMVHSR